MKNSVLPVSYQETIGIDQCRPSHRNWFIVPVQVVTAIPPLLASALYFPAARNFLSAIDLDKPAMNIFVGISCIIAELCLYEVKTMNYGKMLGEGLHELAHCNSKHRLQHYLRERWPTLLKHLFLTAVSLESAYVYFYLTVRLLGNTELATSALIAKYTTFHYSLNELIMRLGKMISDSNQSTVVRTLKILSIIFIGAIGASYVYGQSDDAFLDRNAQPFVAHVLAICSTVPTAFLTGNSVLNIFADIRCQSGQFSMAKLLLQLTFLWLAMCAAAPNAYFMLDWGDRHLVDWLTIALVASVGVLSTITKRDSIPKSANFIASKARLFCCPNNVDRRRREIHTSCDELLATPLLGHTASNA